jgi:hypothetical protein
VSEKPLPTFFNALQAIWALTWKGQWTAARLPYRFGVLLVLPALVLITVDTVQRWSQRQSSFGSAFVQTDSIAKRLDRRQVPLQQAQRDSLRAILQEEFQRLQSLWTDEPNESVATRKTRLEEHLGEFGRRILDRVKDVLDGRQMAEMRLWEAKFRDSTVERLSAIQPGWGRTTPFYHWLIDCYFFIILPLTCVRACGALIRDELQADTLGFLITRPISRARLLVVKYIAQVVWLELLLLVETLLLFGTGFERDILGLSALFPLFLVVQIAAIPAWCALGALLGQITTRYMAAALIYGAVVEMGIGRIPTNINSLSLLRHLETLLSRNGTLEGIFSWDVGNVWVAVSALVLAPVIFGGIAAFLFSMIEYHAAAEMQK